jgi:hypothetical protein
MGEEQAEHDGAATGTGETRCEPQDTGEPDKPDVVMIE